MNVRIVCVGKLKERYWREACAEYAKRLGAYCRFSIVERRESRSDDIEEEGRAILEAISDRTYVITCEIGGRRMSSEQLAAKIEALALEGKSDITFVIGGSNGLSEAVRRQSDLALSFSDMTFPHQLMRVILTEQIYRSFKIIRQEKYHK